MTRMELHKMSIVVLQTSLHLATVGIDLLGEDVL
jgi:hypothetical protein